MPDFVKKIKKSAVAELQAGEELLAGTAGQPSGTFSRLAFGGLVGAPAAGKAADERTGSLDGADSGGFAASIPDNQQLAIGLTDRRLLFFTVGVLSGSPRNLVRASDLSDVLEMSLEKHKMTSSLQIRFVDQSVRIFECVASPRAMVDTFTKLKATRAA